jgi:hypothetical protein
MNLIARIAKSDEMVVQVLTVGPLSKSMQIICQTLVASGVSLRPQSNRRLPAQKNQLYLQSLDFECATLEKAYKLISFKRFLPFAFNVIITLWLIA